MVRRRRLVLGAAALAAGGWVAASAAQAGRPKRVGILRVVGEDFTEALRAEKEALLEALAAHGWRDGKNLEVLWFEFPWDVDRNEAVPRLTRQMVAANLACMVASGDVLARHLTNATRTIPIVAEMNDPVTLGFVASLARPGGNITGLHRGVAEVSMKRIQFFRALVPETRAVAWIGYRPSVAFLPSFEAAAREGRLSVHQMLLDSLGDEGIAALNAEFPRLRPAGCLAAHIFTTSPDLNHAAGRLALKHRIALSRPGSVETEGVLFTYGPDMGGTESMRRFAGVVARILKGEKPGEIAIEGPTRYRLGINLRTAERIGATFPREMLVLADETVR